MLSKWCEVVSCDGVRDWYHARKKPAPFTYWTVVMIVLIICSIWFTYRTILRYNESPSVTNINIVTKSAMDLPDILICFDGGLNVSAFKELNFTEDFIYAFQASLTFTNVTQTKHAAAEYDKKLKKFLLTHKMKLSDLANKVGFDCEDIVLPTYSVMNNSTMSCDDSEQWFTDAGKCFAFKPKYTQKYPYIAGGYQITLKKPRNSFLSNFPNVSMQLNLNNDFKIAIERNLHQQPSLRYLLIPTNTRAEIVLNTKQFIRLSEGSGCTNDAKMSTSNTCYVDCWISSTKNCCNCKTLSVLGPISDNSTTICNPFTFSLELINRDEINKCCNNCKPLCDEWLFDPTVTYSTLDPLMVNAPVSLVSIGYNTMQYIKIEEVKAFTLDMAISNIGGQSGLWVGISAVTFAQTLYHLVLCMYEKFTERNLVQLTKEKNKK